MAGTIIYSTVADILNTAEVILHMDGIGGFRTVMLGWLNEGQLEIETDLRLNGSVYEALRASGQSGTDIPALTAGTSSYAFSTRMAAIDLDSVRDNIYSITFRKEEEVRRTLDRGWDDAGKIEHFSLRPSAFKFWRVPDASYIASHPTIYFDYFARLNKFTAETDPLTQYYEHDRLALVQYVVYRGYGQADDSREDKAYGQFLDSVMRMGGSGNAVQGVGGPPTEIGLGAYFDPDYER